MEQAEVLIMNVLRWMDLDELMEEDLYDAIDHGELVGRLVNMMCIQLGCPIEFHRIIVQAAYLHDIGKLKLSKNLYGRDKNALQIEEARYMRMHAKLGADMLRECGYCEEICRAVYHHHENFDGSGYPENLAGEEIPLEARILKVCDVFAALISDRPYRKGFDMDKALELMIEDHKVFDMKIFLEFLKIYNSNAFKNIVEFSRHINSKKRYIQK